MPLSLIPQIFYDMIARVLPGSLVLIFGYLAYWGPISTWHAFAENAKPQLFSIFSVIVYFILSYILGFIIAEFWSLTFGRLQRKKAFEISETSLEASIKNFNTLRAVQGQPSITATAKDFPPLFVLHDHLRLQSSDDAFRLLKVQGEQRLCYVLSFSFIVFFLGNILCLASGLCKFSIDRTGLLVFFVASIYLLWQKGHRYTRYYANGLGNMWLFYNFQ